MSPSPSKSASTTAVGTSTCTSSRPPAFSTRIRTRSPFFATVTFSSRSSAVTRSTSGVFLSSCHIFRKSEIRRSRPFSPRRKWSSPMTVSGAAFRATSTTLRGRLTLTLLPLVSSTRTWSQGLGACGTERRVGPRGPRPDRPSPGSPDAAYQDLPRSGRPVAPLTSSLRAAEDGRFVEMLRLGHLPGSGPGDQGRGHLFVHGLARRSGPGRSRSRGPADGPPARRSRPPPRSRPSGGCGPGPRCCGRRPARRRAPASVASSLATKERSILRASRGKRCR